MKETIYKYLPSKYADDYLSGKILFRPISYFIHADDLRGDNYEGSHVDWPDDDVSFEILGTDRKTVKQRITGDFAFRRSLKNPHKVFIHCTSLRLANELYDRFNADCCIEIQDLKEFSKRLRSHIHLQVPFLDKNGIYFDRVEYYDIKQAGVYRDIERPEHVPLFKPADYSCEEEFRFFFSRPGGLDTQMQLTNSAYDRKQEEALKQTFRKKFIDVGNISSFCRVHTMRTASAA